MSVVSDFQNSVKPNWCPGCGHFSILSAIQKALSNLGRAPHEVAVISGIGCSGRISGYMYAYGFHSIHGRTLPIAQGVKMANHDLTVLACGGDGDGFAIGTNHTIHAMRRNIDITYIVMDNHIYGLTKGQTSPRSDLGAITKSTPQGSIEQPLSIMEMALTAGATFAAQSFSLNLAELTDLIEQGINHKGFSFINVFSPCVTFNKINSYEWYKKHLISTDSITNYNPNDKLQAMHKLMHHNGLLTGLIFQETNQPAYENRIKGFPTEALAKKLPVLEKAEFAKLLQDFM